VTGPSPEIDVSLLRLDDVSVTYPGRDGGGTVEVLKSLSLSARRGRFTCLAGRSGSGKTTALRVAAGLLRPTQGTVTWEGEQVGSLTEDARVRRRGELIGFVFQSGGLVAALTAAENVALAGLATGIGRAGQDRARSVLELVGFPSTRARHLPSQLSGGEQQRVGLARALFRDPPVLLVDEPTANLDRRSADEIIELLVGLTESDRALLVASHDRALIDRADTVIELP